MKRNPHPARRSRVATLGISTSAFVSIVIGLVWNTQQAEIVANVTDANAALVEQETSVPSTTTSAVPVAGSTTPTATIAPSAPAVTTNKNATATVAPATPANNFVAPANNSVAPATTTGAPAVAPAAAVVAPVVAPAAPAPAAVYTCMSPGGKTENPSGSGSCPNAKYGYTLTQI